MFLSAHFYLWFWLLIFLIVDYVVYYDFISLTVFDWMPGVSFTLLGAECVCNPGNPLELFFWDS